MKSFIVVTLVGKDNSNFTEKEMNANTLEELIEKISKTNRGKMDYKIFTGKPFTFENMVYSNRV